MLGQSTFSGETLFRFEKYHVLFRMENENLSMLTGIVLPAQILDYFTIAGVSQTSTEIHISLDEKMSPELSSDVHFESKGCMEPVNVTDFPIRDHKVILRIRPQALDRHLHGQELQPSDRP